MFWHCVRDGLRVLLHWETYVAGLEYFAIVFVSLIALVLLWAKIEDRTMITKIVVGSSGIFVMSVARTIAAAIFVLTLSPIILGVSDDAAWSFPWRLGLPPDYVPARIRELTATSSLFGVGAGPAEAGAEAKQAAANAAGVV